MNFRHRAKQCLENATLNIDKGEERNLRYVALDLRMTLEALIYEKARGYIGELPEKDINIWQPRILLKKLIEIDPNVEFDTTLSAGLQEEIGKPAKELIFFGAERVLTLKEIKTYYDRLGSFLHVPTFNQINKGKIASNEKIEANCKELINILTEVLSSPIFNVNTKNAIDWECSKCNSKVIRRIPFGEESFSANCPYCIASYVVSIVDNNSYQPKPLLQKAICSNPSCKKENSLWENGIGLHKQWVCSKCKTKHIFMLSSFNLEELKNQGNNSIAV